MSGLDSINVTDAVQSLEPLIAKYTDHLSFCEHFHSWINDKWTRSSIAGTVSFRSSVPFDTASKLIHYMLLEVLKDASHLPYNYHLSPREALCGTGFAIDIRIVSCKKGTLPSNSQIKNKVQITDVAATENLELVEKELTEVTGVSKCHKINKSEIKFDFNGLPFKLVRDK